MNLVIIFFIIKKISDLIQNCSLTLYQIKLTNVKNDVIMKTYFLKYAFMACVMAAGLPLFQSCDDNDDTLVTPPTEVLNSFDSLYPDSRVKEWEYKQANYEAEFYFTGTCTTWNIPLTNVEADAYFTNSGSWIHTEFDIDSYWWRQDESSVIPTTLRTAIQNQLNGRKLDDLKIIDRADNDDYYLLEIDNEPQDILVMLDYDGNVIQ